MHIRIYTCIYLHGELLCKRSFFHSIVDSIADRYMLIEKLQVQPKGPKPALPVYNATEP